MGLPASGLVFKKSWLWRQEQSSYAPRESSPQCNMTVDRQVDIGGAKEKQISSVTWSPLSNLTCSVLYLPDRFVRPF